MSKPFTQLALIRCLQSGGRENGQVDSAASGVVPVVCVFLGSGERDFPGSSRAVSGRWGWCGFGGGAWLAGQWKRVQRRRARASDRCGENPGSPQPPPPSTVTRLRCLSAATCLSLPSLSLLSFLPLLFFPSFFFFFLPLLFFPSFWRRSS